jgi:hypothetical protein
MREMSYSDRRDLFESAFYFDNALDGEDEEKHDALATLVEEELQPADTFERFMAQDIITLRWEKLRHEDFKRKVISLNYYEAIASILERIYVRGALVGGESMAAASAKADAEKFRKDPDANDHVTVRLAEHGFDQIAINAEAFLISAVTLDALERRIAAVQSREIKLLREYWDRRERARRGLLLSAKLVDSLPMRRPEQAT